MKSNLSLISLLILTALQSCSGDIAQLLPRSQAISAQSITRQMPIESLVDRNRLEKHVAALSGKAPVGPQGLIPERGSVQGRALTRTYLTQTLESLGYKVETHNYRANGSNILTRLMADKPTDEYIMMGAHLDSVKNPGANDNGTGSAAVLEAAAVFKQMANRKVNIMFAWFDEEELGLVGSKYLARDLKKQGLKITSMHNIDMLGWDSDGDKTVELAQPDGILFEYYKMVNKTHQLNLPFDRTNTGQSDHESFHHEGFPSICISEQYTNGDTTPHYHRKSDTFATVNLDYLTLSTRLVVAVVGDLSMQVSPPAGIQIIPHDRFPSRPREFHASYDDHILD